jgi:LysR family glycine cleavage system transcriptional activator
MAVTHLKSLQALEMAIRSGSLKDAADRLGITPAAVGQRIRALEDYLGSDLLARGRSGMQATAELQPALADLRAGFAALERASEALDFQRVAEIHIVADTDWADLWLLPRLAAYRAANPNVRLNVNGVGDVPMRLGAPDLRITQSEDATAEVLFTDWLAPVATADNLARIAGRARSERLEGMPLLHVERPADRLRAPVWADWFAMFGGRSEGLERGAHFRETAHALAAARVSTGFMLCGLSLILDEIADGRLRLPFPAVEGLPAHAPYRLKLGSHAGVRPQLRRFHDWLLAEAAATAARLAALTDQAAFSASTTFG